MKRAELSTSLSDLGVVRLEPFRRILEPDFNNRTPVCYLAFLWVTAIVGCVESSLKKGKTAEISFDFMRLRVILITNEPCRSSRFYPRCFWSNEGSRHVKKRPARI